MAGSGSYLNEFADFVAATGHADLSPSKFINDAGYRTYEWTVATDGQAKETILRGGNRIREDAMWNAQGTFRAHKTGENRTWTQPQVLETIFTDWRFNEDHMAWSDPDIDLNDQVTMGTAEGRFQQFVRIRDKLKGRMFTSMMNGLEDQMWAVPDKSTMEGQAGIDPYSIWVFVNEEANGLHLDGPGGDFTTVHGIDPTSADTLGPDGVSRWIPQNEQYDSSDAGNAGNVIGTFDRMIEKIHYRRPRTYSQYFEDPMLRRQVILTSAKGMSVIRTLYREGQDFYVYGGQDPAYPNPHYNGIEIRYVEHMDTAAVYQTDGGTLLTTEQDGTADDKGPRFLWLNYNFLFPVMHVSRSFKPGPVTAHHNVPDVHVQRYCVWYNWVCCSRTRQGIVWPDGDIYA